MIPTLFFIFLSLFVIAFILVIVNMVLMTRNVLDVDNIGKGFGKHIIFGGIAGLFGMASLVTGIIWIVQVFVH
jgi:hypothetical protein